MRGRTRARARLVAAELEQRWNARLLAVRALDAELEALAASAETTLTQVERDRLLALGADIRERLVQCQRDTYDAQADHPDADRRDRSAG